ncbi:MAG: GNAT family N-acetyltransferase, partial [Oscillospiraceae bacterium]|nr:GNAT family N-acetyltransferase [Oscillospiraceae bacterium]
MEVQITKGRPEDHMDIVDFIGMVFREDFLVTESKLYLDRPELAEKHHLVFEDDRIKAVVGNFPISLNVAGRKLPCYGIGSVAVHPYTRGKG